MEIEIIFKSGFRMGFECKELDTRNGLSVVLGSEGERVDFIKSQIEYFVVPFDGPTPKCATKTRTKDISYNTYMFHAYHSVKHWQKLYTRGKVIYRNNTQPRRRQRAK